MTLRVALNQGGGNTNIQLFFFFLRIKLYRVLSNFPQYAMKRHLQAAGMCRIHLPRTQSGKD